MPTSIEILNALELAHLLRVHELFKERGGEMKPDEVAGWLGWCIKQSESDLPFRLARDRFMPFCDETDYPGAKALVEQIARGTHSLAENHAARLKSWLQEEINALCEVRQDNFEWDGCCGTHYVELDAKNEAWVVEASTGATAKDSSVRVCKLR